MFTTIYPKVTSGLALTMVLSLFPGLANADGVGLMIGGGIYYTELDDDFDGNDFDWDDVEEIGDLEVLFDDKSGGFNATVGWRFNKWLSVDAGYWDLGEFKSDRFEDIDRVKFDTTAWTVGGMVSVPLWILDIYARGGAAFWEADSRNFDEDGTDPYYGAGVSLNLLGSLDLYLEVIRFDLETDIDTAGIGARWTF
jgi:OOP family OmpA-OmpF porin